MTLKIFLITRFEPNPMKSIQSPIYVTQPYLPEVSEFIPYIERIWENKILTNGGELHNQLEKELENFLGVKNVVLFSNGTSALITAIQALDLPEGGEVITTPYSFVATAHSIIWNKLKPVFVDIESHSPNIDIDKIKDAYSDKTVAIMPVHCYGIPCNVKEIDAFAKAKNIKVLYDAAHAFGVKVEDGSVLNYGDMSVLSFHATKVFNTFEGGAVICHTPEMKQKLNKLKNFGIINGGADVTSFGSNGKMSEIHAAFGLLQLKYIDKLILQRKKIYELYTNELKEIEGIDLLSRNLAISDNYSYLPIVINKNYPLSRDDLFNKIIENDIFPRKYFYPLITDFKAYKKYKSYTPNSRNLSKCVLCLPIYPNLEEENIKEIICLIKENCIND